jgi:hypothetical protein
MQNAVALVEPETAAVADVTSAVRSDCRAVRGSSGPGDDLVGSIRANPQHLAAGKADDDHRTVRHRDRSFHEPKPLRHDAPGYLHLTALL